MDKENSTPEELTAEEIKILNDAFTAYKIIPTVLVNDKAVIDSINLKNKILNQFQTNPEQPK